MSNDRSATWERPPLPRPKQPVATSRGKKNTAFRLDDGAFPSRLMNGLWVVGFFAVATLVLTYPLGVYPSSLSRLDNGDARLNAWAMSWVANQAFTDPLRLFQANIFHPLPNSLAFSEHLFVEGILAAPILWLSDDLVLTQNLVILLATFLGGVGMYLLTSAVTGSRTAGLVAGLFFTFAPYRFNRLPHVQMQLYGFIPMTLWALVRYFQSFRRRWLVWFVLAFVTQVLSGTYLAAMAAIAVAIALVLLTPWRRIEKRHCLDLAIGLLVAALLILPFVVPYLWVNRTLGVEWDLEGVAQLAATPRTYLAASSHLHRGWTESLTTPRDRIDFLFPGFSLVALALGGLALLLRRPQSRRMAAYLVVLALVGVVLSLGPLTPVYRWLFDHVLFLRGLRALPRFSLLALVSLSVLAGVSVAWLERRTPRRATLVAVIALAYVAETTAIPYELEEFRDSPPEVYEWLASAKPGVIVELPYKVIDTRYMFWARHHDFRPMLNGDSGFIPESHNWMKQALQRFPSPDSIELLRRQRVRYVVIHLGALRTRALVRLLNGLEGNRSALLPVRDFGREAVFEILPPLESTPLEVAPPALEAIAIASSEIAQLTDQDYQTPWRPDANITSVTFQPASPRPVQGVRLHYGAHPRVPAVGVELKRLSDDGSSETVYATTAEWPAITELVSGLLEDPGDGTQTLRFPPVNGERFSLGLVGFDGPIELTEVELLAEPTSQGPPAS